MLKELKSRSLSGKTKSLITLLLMCCCTFSQWIQTTSTPEGSGITGMTAKGDPYNWIFVSTGSVSGGQQGGIRRSTDGGDTWQNLYNCYIARTIIQQAYGVYASIWNYPSQNEGIYRMNSTYHYEWNPVFNFATTGNNIFSLLNPADTLIFAGTRTGVLRSTDFGVSFNYSNSGIPANSWVFDLAADSNNIIAAATSNGLFISTNLGDSWQQTTGVPAGDTVKCLTFARYAADANGTSNALYAGTDDGKILIAKNQTAYLAVVVANLIDPNMQFEKGYTVRNDLEYFDHTFFTGRPRQNLPGGGVYRSENGGQTFTALNEGLPQNPVVSAITGIPGITSKELIAGFFNNTNNGGSVYKRTLPIGIKNISSEIPKVFSLSQNYPNPFNPVTKIRFDIPPSEGGRGRIIQIKIFDILGREINTLVNQQLQPGTYEVDWNAANYTSGVYFYRIAIHSDKMITNGYSETRKMMLLK